MPQADLASMEQALRVRAPQPLDAALYDWQLPAMQSLVQQHLNQQRANAQKFHLIVLPEDGHPSLETYETIEPLMAAIRGYLGRPVSLFPVLGHHLPISRGPNRFLLTPMGPLPLFTIPDADSLEAEANGYVGEEPLELAIPSTPNPEEAEELDEAGFEDDLEDGFEDEDDGSPAAPVR